MRDAWDAFVRTSRNGTFLFERPFMDYHADRFEDHSLLFAQKGKILGVLPCSSHGDGIVSHGGLTYGGFLLANSARITDVGTMLDEALDYYKAKNFRSLTIKPIPSIYHTQCSDDELYWLFRRGAVLSTRGLSSAIDLNTPLPFSTLRKRKIKKATESNLQIVRDIPLTDAESWATFWTILADVLAEQHSKTPVHSLDEILLLKSRFPHEIQLWCTGDADGTIIAGSLLFITKNVVHAQYIAASHRGKDLGALDLLFSRIVEACTDTATSTTESFRYPLPRFLDFGISTEDGGAYLNEGLVFQKEGFGARSVVYDAYTLSL